MILKKLRLLLILLGIFAFVAVFGDQVSPDIKSFFYAVSLSLKQILLFFIPFVIFSLVFYALTSLKGGVFSFITKLVSCVYASNFIAILMAYLVSSNILGHIQKPMEKAAAGSFNALAPMWSFKLPELISNEIALIAGFACGIIFSLFPMPAAQKAAQVCNNAANFFLKRMFIPVLPLFILGLVFKLQNDQLLSHAVSICGPVFLLIVGLQTTYMLFLYFVAAGFSPSRWMEYLKNIFPASLTAFSSMSSIAAMPVTLISTEQNLKSSSLSRLLIPATVNIHTLGSAIGLTTLAVATSLAFNGVMPDFSTFLHYAVFYAFAKFSVAAVPGGAVAVAMPLMEKYLGFTPEMTGLITVFYMMFDPFGTATNVTGNGAFAILFKKIARLKAPAGEAKEVAEDGELLASRA
jgi:Na+/H+-dicarboxylate symporter